MKILIVDDSRAMRTLIRRTLRGGRYVGAVIQEVENGRQALDAVRTGSPDLVLANWNMREMTGIELLETLQAAGVASRFGFITSDASDGNRARALAAGACFLIGKPFTRAGLRHVVDEVVALRDETKPEFARLVVPGAQ